MKRILLFWLWASSVMAQGPRMNYVPSVMLSLTAANASLPNTYTFTRANATATRTNSYGLLETVAANTPRFDYDPASFVTTQNLISQSESFSAANWSKTNISVAISTTIAGPFGGSVPKVVESPVAGTHTINQSNVATGIYCFSVYAKAAERNWLWLYFGSIGGGSAWFDLSAGATAAIESNVAAEITAVGNGWYRCSITKLITTTHGSIAANVTTGSGVTNYTGDGTSGLYITGAQVNPGAFPVAYRVTTTETVGTTAGPTLLGLLMEEQRTNLVTYSQFLPNGAWSKGAQVTVTQPSIIGPFGSNTVSQLVAVAGTGNSLVRQGANVTTGQVYTFSAYVKKANYRYVGIRCGGTGYANIAFDFDTQTFPTAVSGYTTGYRYVGNGWYRVWVTHTVVSGEAGFIYAGFCIPDITNAESRTYTGGETVWVGGAQLELGGSPTSYIVTTGTSVTRSNELCYLPIGGWFNKNGGTLIAEGFQSVQPANSSQIFASIGNGTSSLIALRIRSIPDFFGMFRDPSIGNGDSGGISITIGQVVRAGLRYEANKPITTTRRNTTALGSGAFTPSMGANWARMGIGCYPETPGNGLFNGYVTAITYYPFAHATKQVQAWSN